MVPPPLRSCGTGSRKLTHAAANPETGTGDGAAPGATGAETTVAVVMPAWNAAEHLERSLPAAIAAAGPSGVIVVDAGSTDATGAVAERLGASVVRLPRRAGPAEARNAGVERAGADVVLFIDADCIAKPDVVERVRAAFAKDPGLVSLTGSYCDSPADAGFFSQYMNLRHHFTHQQARRDDATFWAGCGAVRRDAFQAVGGFDARRFPLPMIEDIELGLRLRRRGATRLDPDLQVTHLKRWSLVSVVATDIMRRAVPWTRLILERADMPNDLNLRASQRLAAALAPFVLLGCLALPWFVAAGAGRFIPLTAVVIGAALALNGPMTAFFRRRRGIGFAIGAFLFHQVHLTYSAATFAFGVLRHRSRKPEAPAA